MQLSFGTLTAAVAQDEHLPVNKLIEVWLVEVLDYGI